MAGQILKKGPNRWVVRVQKRDHAGRRHSYSKTILGTKKEAEKHLARVLHEMHEGTFAAPSDVTWVRYSDLAHFDGLIWPTSMA